METKMATLTQLQIDAIRGAWCRETSADPAKWTPDNAAYGQCAVTALVVQDFVGGRLMRASVGGVSHYWNDGLADLTFEQFPSGAMFDGWPLERDRAYVLGFPATAERYLLLKARVLQGLELHNPSVSESGHPGDGQA
jgi:hypothetical protein